MTPYQALYDLVNTYIFGGSVEVGTYTELVCILVATVGSLFVIALPFVIVLKVINMLLR